MSHQYLHLILGSVIALSLFTYTTSSSTKYFCRISGDPHYDMFGEGHGHKRTIHHYSGVGHSTLVTSSVFNLQFTGIKCGGHGRGINETGHQIPVDPELGWGLSDDGSHSRTGPSCMGDYHMELRLNPNCPQDITHVLVYNKTTNNLELNGETVVFSSPTLNGPFNNEASGSDSNPGDLQFKKKNYGFEVTLNYPRGNKILFEMGRHYWMNIKLKHEVENSDYMASASGLCGRIGSLDLHAKDGTTKSIPEADVNDWHARWLGRSPSKWRDDNTFLSSWHVKETDSDFIKYVAEKVNTADATECLPNPPPPTPPLERTTAPTPQPTPAPTPATTPPLGRRSFRSLSADDGDDDEEVDNDAPDCSDITTMVMVTSKCEELQGDTDGLDQFEISARNDAMALCILDRCAGSDESVATSTVMAFTADMQEVHPKPEDPLPYIITGTVAISGLVAFVIAFVHHRFVANQHKKQLMLLDPRLQQQYATENML